MNRDIPITAESDVRETPDSLYLPLDAEFRFDLDACATHANARCRLYWTEQGLGSNGQIIAPGCGLTGTWEGSRVWCNPPFSDIGAWVNKAWFAGAEVVVMLVPATRTEQGWWHEYVEPYRDRPPSNDGLPTLTTRFIPGRVHFLENGHPIYRKKKDGTLWTDPISGKYQVSSPKFGCVLLIFRK
jgi:phage N-6-adenine-methyltransferase